MDLYMSGTPNNDVYQVLENRLNSHRLFSMHPNYQAEVFRWLDAVREGVDTVDAFVERYPEQKTLLDFKDHLRRVRESELGIKSDWGLLEGLRTACDATKPSMPHSIMLDSGAFTAWGKGRTLRLNKVLSAYRRFIESADGRFEVWLVNLDVIPGKKGEPTTPKQVHKAIAESDSNFEVLTREFGNCVLPVFHQEEPRKRLMEIIDQADGHGDYICISPKNDYAEPERIRWAREANKAAEKRAPHIKRHGLATTGNRMVREVFWSSADSAAWKKHGVLGTIDLHYGNFKGVDVIPKEHIPSQPYDHYIHYHVGLEQAEYDMTYRQILPAARRAFDRLPRDEQRRVQDAVSKYGFPFDLIRWEPRARGLICMGELRKFSTEVEDHPRPGWAYMPEINPDKLPAPGSGEQSAPGKSRKQPTDVASRPNKPKSKKHDSKLQTKEDAKVGHFMRLVEALDVIINPKFWKSDGDKVRRSQVAHWIGVSIGWYTDNELLTMNEEVLLSLHQVALELAPNEDLTPQLERLKSILSQRSLKPDTSCETSRLLSLFREGVAKCPEDRRHPKAKEDTSKKKAKVRK